MSKDGVVHYIGVLGFGIQRVEIISVIHEQLSNVILIDAFLNVLRWRGG